MGLLRTVGRTAVIAGTASAVGGRVQHRQQQKWSAQEQQQYEAQQAQEAPAAPTEDDTVAQLKQLAELHSQGILTDEEFAAKKAQILGI
jgi:membrane protease subunit (stomatin/prohibitin family)